MTKHIRTAAAAAGLLAALALPVASSAASSTSGSPQQYTMQTRFADEYHGGEWDATMVLTVYPNGIVQGTYRPQDGGWKSVTGGVDGQQIWLDIGMMHPLHLTGTFRNGELRTIAAIPGPDTYTLESTSVTRNG